MNVRVGFGFDIHRLVENRKLILGGVKIDFPRGLGGHSDADVLIHSVCDALLGAAGLGDLGKHFPATDPQFKDCPSAELLRRVHSLIQSRGFRIVNIDSTLIAETPKLAPYLESMVKSISGILSIPPGEINVKAKSYEGLDSIGRGEAIAAQAVAVIRKG
jgi:2-C-methyl-D-erythritol 2,4-cyclodiphosphate synthase